MSYEPEAMEMELDWCLCRKLNGDVDNAAGIRTKTIDPASSILLPAGAKTAYDEVEILHAGPGWHDGRMFRDTSILANHVCLIRGLRESYEERVVVGGEELMLIRGRDVFARVAKLPVRKEARRRVKARA